MSANKKTPPTRDGVTDEPHGATPAETIRRAATLIRTRAEAVVPGTYDVTVHLPSPQSFIAGAHLSGWSPPVALAVADWLDEVYVGITGSPTLGLGSNAYRIARAYLGEQP